MIPLYPGPAPGSESWSHEQQDYFSELFNTQVVTNVTRPSLTPFLPDHGNGTAVIIAPGGGFHALSIDSEGNDVARWLNRQGIAAFVLRYRLVPTEQEAVAEMFQKKPETAQADMARIAPLAGADGLRALQLVKARAGEFNVDVNRVGFLGFSAGGAVAVTTATAYGSDNRPAFVAPIYAGTGSLDQVVVPEDAPPMFLLAASDDQLGLAKDSVNLYNTWIAAEKSAELHLYATGGHGFGMRKQELPSDSWIELFARWLGDRGFLTAG